MNYAEFKKSFKHGDKVTCTINDKEVTDAKISIGTNDVVYLCQNYKDGYDASDKLGYEYSLSIFYYGSDTETPRNSISNLKLYKKERAEDLKVGDIVIDNGDNQEKIVLGVLGKLVFLSGWDNFDSSGGEYTFTELNSRLNSGSWKIKQEEIAEEVEELTMEEVCEKLGKTIKIKKSQ